MKSRVDKAFEQADRMYFLPPEAVQEADIDAAVPIGFGQTNSQPYTVRLMLEWLDVQLGQKVLDVGSGSGWTSALLSILVGNSGSVIAVEKIPQLVQTGKQNCKKLRLKNIKFKQAGDSLGWPQEAPYERILVSASAKVLPEQLVSQLGEGGIMVIPVKNSILVVKHVLNDNFKVEEHSGFVFVPLL